QRCIELAALGHGQVSPNPMVGCVIVHKDTVIGEGYHQKYGESHAEVNAIRSVFTQFGNEAPALLRDATAYVTLEPCAHFGKTPPCADLLVRHQLKAVVIGNHDPFAAVNGKGIAKLEDAGISVKIGVLEKACAHLNRRFFTRVQQQRPFIILKWAQTADGFFAPADQSQRWITGAEAKALSHQWRSQEDAVLIGKNTALVDNPALTNRLVAGKSPIRLVVDKHLSVPVSHKVYNNEAKTIIFNEEKTAVNGNIHFIQIEDMHFYLAQKIAFQLYLMDIQSVIIEGGINLLDQFVKANLWDEARIFTSTTTWGNGRLSPIIKGVVVENIVVGSDTLHILSNSNL
ncbi:MAG: bifunctional diaminohydroxyphosphoribosylaminopyrimidine deaminase/5-amino-6-(5-phosphoribosylamino)uracil reductase RibD, partial [Bacteroidia bacterium]